MSYNYRTRTDKLRIHIKSIQNKIHKIANTIKENAYHYELIERPEVNWVEALPAPGETSY